jgi:hypothetical protein
MAWAQSVDGVLRSVEQTMGTAQLKSVKYSVAGTSMWDGQGLSPGTVVNWS